MAEKREKVCRSQLIQAVADNSGINSSTVEVVVKSLLDTMIEMLIDNKEVVFTNLGTFHIQSHKGHPVQFANDGAKIEDYKVVKFKVAPSVKKKIKERCCDIVE